MEKLNLLPGVTVDANTVLLELVNPDVEIQTLNADRQQTDAESQLVQLKTSLNSNRLAQASIVANLRSTWLDAKRRAESGAELLEEGSDHSARPAEGRRSWPMRWASRWSSRKSGSRS